MTLSVEEGARRHFRMLMETAIQRFINVVNLNECIVSNLN